MNVGEYTTDVDYEYTMLIIATDDDRWYESSLLSSVYDMTSDYD